MGTANNNIKPKSLEIPNRLSDHFAGIGTRSIFMRFRFRFRGSRPIIDALRSGRATVTRTALVLQNASFYAQYLNSEVGARLCLWFLFSFLFFENINPMDPCSLPSGEFHNFTRNDSVHVGIHSFPIDTRIFTFRSGVSAVKWKRSTFDLNALFQRQSNQKWIKWENDEQNTLSIEYTYLYVYRMFATQPPFTFKYTQSHTTHDDGIRTNYGKLIHQSHSLETCSTK